MRKLVKFFKESKRELLEKTTWPALDAVRNTTIVVIISIIILSIGLFIVDFLSNVLVQFIVVENVNDFKASFDWFLEDWYGIPYRVLLTFFAIIFLYFIINKIRKR